MFPTPPPRLVGDYNQNGIVDAADYVVWRDTLGTQAPKGSGADGNANGRIEATDYDVWKEHYGQEAQATRAHLTAATITTIPEPATLWLAAITSCAATICNRGKRHAAACHPSMRYTV